MVNAQKRVKGLLKKEGLFIGLKIGKVYEFEFVHHDKTTIELIIYDNLTTISLILPSPYIEEFVQILDGPAANILFNNNK